MDMNIWDYRYEDNVRIVDVDNKEYFGSVVNIWTAEEIDEEEDQIDIETKDGIFGLFPSEILSIEISGKNMENRAV